MTSLQANNLEGDFRIGSLISSTFSVLHSALGPFLILAAIPLVPQYLAAIPGISVPSVGLQPDTGMLWLSGLLGIIGAVLLFLMQGAMVYAAFGVVRGRNPSLGEAFSRGLARLLPLLGVAIVSGVAISFGFLLLIVPGLWMVCMWYAAAAVCVVESRGVFSSIRRSGDLTKGYRWKILGLLLIVAILNIVVTFVVVAIGSAVAGNAGALVLRFAVSLYTTAFGSVLAALSYYALRSVKEGIDIDRIAEVFD